MGAYDDRLYDVGKGKPPKSSQWKPGQSGNPSGPKRKAKPETMSKGDLLASVLNEKVTGEKNGRHFSISLKQFIMTKLMEDAVNGTPAQRIKVVDTLLKHGAFDLPASAAANYDIPASRTADMVKQLAAEFGFDASTGEPYDPVDQPGSNG